MTNSCYMDLRAFLARLEAEGELKRVKAAVDAKHELGAICKLSNEKPNSPALLFENVRGSTIPVVGQLLASDKRVAMALDLSQENVFEETVERANHPLTTRFQPATDMYVIPRGITSTLEPSSTPDGVTSKLMADATMKKDFRGEVAEPTDEMRELVKQRWREYGL